MSDDNSTDLTILFADVAGSVKVYDTLGDTQAHGKIVKCLQLMTSMVEQNHGQVVEIIGDEIMCAFKEPDSAFEAACNIQNALGQDQQSYLGARVGFHCGKTGMQNGHPFGDTVNVGARMVELAKAGQAIMSEQVYARLSPFNKLRSRYFDQVYIKGKQQPYSVYQAIWDQNDSTLMMTQKPVSTVQERRRQIKALSLRYLEMEKVLTEANSEFLLGRGKQCGLTVGSKAASRVHATISFLGKKLVIVDRSTNGTYIRIPTGKRSIDGLDLFFHHEEWRGDCDGVISLGEPATDQNQNLIHFKCIH